MGMSNNGELGLQESSMGFLNSQFPEVYPDTGRETMRMIRVWKADQFVVTEWDPLVVPTAQSGDFRRALSLPAFDSGVMGSQEINCSSVGMADDMSTIPCNAGFGLLQFISSDQADLAHEYDRNVAEDVSGEKRKNLPGCSGLSSSSLFNMGQNTDPEKPNGMMLAEARRLSETKDEKRQRSKQNSGGNVRKQSSKQIKGQKQSGADGKEDYIHVRAKRGQATNSHSLAERVRREKISERMRFLQNLVPGCNKITGKAVMLDEIINYVQSLQRQVEFLSMKLATVHPEMNLDILQLLAKDMPHSTAGCSQPVSFGPGMVSMCRSDAFVPQPEIRTEMLFNRVSNPQDMTRNCSNQIPPVAETSSWDDELHNAIQIGFITHMSVGLSYAEPPGSGKDGSTCVCRSR